MSRTRKSRPQFVRIREAKPLEVESWHTLACREGRQECDLPDRAETPHHSNQGRCCWLYRGEERTCGCGMCTMSRERRQERRRFRHGKRRAIADGMD